MNKIVFIGYFLLRSDYKSVFQSLHCAHKRFGRNRLMMLADMLYCALKYGASFADYFNYQFFRKSHTERSEYATMGDMYMFHQQMNKGSASNFVDDKGLFFDRFGEFVKKPYYEKKTIQGGSQLKLFLEKNIDKKVVFKLPDSTAGRGVSIKKLTKEKKNFFVDDESIESFLESFFTSSEYFYMEEYLVQHPVLQELSPSAVNTIRLITVLLDTGEVDILGAILRISVNAPIDNFSQGNIAAEIDIQTGMVSTGGIQQQSACADYFDMHPTTNYQIKGLQIPYWQEVIAMAVDAAKVVPSVRTVGWDIAILNDGPVLIEGNSKWGKDTWQIPAGIGKKKMLKKYVSVLV